jgi:hypothetical protein
MRQRRWLELIKDYDMEIKYHPGKANILTDTLLTVKIRQPSHEFIFGVGMSFIPYPLVLTPVV